MNDNAARIAEYLSTFYSPEEWPALLTQAEEWAVTRPLEGLKVLDATPVYRNTLGKYMALLAGGAEVYVPARNKLPGDPAVLRSVTDFGIQYARKGDDFFDIVLDCAGQFCRMNPTLGFCELTRSGVERYEHARRRVFVADSGRIKRIETVLGTGDGFFRALAKLGHGDVSNRRLLIIGYGKVGRGIAFYAREKGMKVTIADTDDKSGELPGEFSFVDANNVEAINEAILRSWCTVTATGHISALRRQLNNTAAAVTNSPVLLANMGVEDEYSSQIPTERVLNNKRPLNFILEEPTAMRYIETTMALHNACGLELLTQDLPNKCMPPSPDVEEHLLNIVCTKGLIGNDIRRLDHEMA